MSNKKEAVNIGITLSTQLITASLTMIILIGTFSTFIVDKRDVGLFYYLLTFTAFILFILSLFYGGKGINQARRNGFNGRWQINDTKKYFNKQSSTALFGIIIFIISTFVSFYSNEKIDNFTSIIKSQNSRIDELEKFIEKNKTNITNLSNKNENLYEENQLIKSELNLLRKSLDKKAAQINSVHDK